MPIEAGLRVALHAGTTLSEVKDTLGLTYFDA